MLKYAVASVVLILGFAVSAPPASAAPRNDDCVNCAPRSHTTARIRRGSDRKWTGRARPTPSPLLRRSERAPVADRSVEAPARDCADCPPPKRYDSTEVVKTSHDVDQSRVINTESVVQVPPRVKEINKLVIHENETRNVGVIQHNHRIIEKEIRYVRRAPVYQRPVHQYVPQYRAVQQVQTVLVPVAAPPVHNCGCPCTCSGGHNAYASASASAYVYQPGFAYDAERGSMQKVWVPVAVPTGYGYR